MFYRPNKAFKISNSLLILLTIQLALLSGCGKSESKNPQMENVETKTLVKKPPVQTSNKIAIPFDIAVQAALEGHTATVQQALDTGTNPNQLDENGRNMLMVASFNGHKDIMEMLIKAGTTIDTQDVAGRTALMFASTGKDMDTISLLLKHGAKVNLVDREEHWSPLMFAAAEGNIEVVQLLLDNGADITHVDIDGESSELFARNNGHTDVADLLKNLIK
ncbi:MAG: ankyrin repeat domain-containing protein [Verrucomicrobia bacterium]|nr:ankyrin repeat domain-containing protein [Verrucomicrobiota bacterium]MDA1065086.1 ankyrin repeat domain-containing protein [Verrucomicrobiota bacterium]